MSKLFDKWDLDEVKVEDLGLIKLKYCNSYYNFFNLISNVCNIFKITNYLF